MRVITWHYTFPKLMQLQVTSRFHFVAALRLPGSEALWRNQRAIQDCTQLLILRHARRRPRARVTVRAYAHVTVRAYHTSTYTRTSARTHARTHTHTHTHLSERARTHTHRCTRATRTATPPSTSQPPPTMMPQAAATTLAMPPPSNAQPAPPQGNSASRSRRRRRRRQWAATPLPPAQPLRQSRGWRGDFVSGGMQRASRNLAGPSR
jgi:hypothetical protein